MSGVELRRVHKSYGRERVLSGLDLTIEPGSFTVLLGPSGCGKSTILRLIAGLEPMESGEVLIGGKGMAHVEPGDRDVAMVFQNYALYPTMSVFENLEFGLRNAGVAKDERSRRIAEVARAVGLTEYLGRKPQQLSGGQRQRVALARAIVKRPAIFLMDEPLSNLDAKLRAQLRSELIELHARLGATFVYVTHDQVEAMSLGTKVILLEKGQIRQEASPEELYAHPLNVFSARFVGTPPMNVVEAAASGTALPEGVRSVGFRPEKATLLDQGQPVPDSSLALEGRILAREMLGSEILYKVEGRGWTATVKRYGETRIAEGAARICVSLSDIHAFGEDGARLDWSPIGGAA